ncbi:MAG: glucosamine-6-phosphate deaminase [Opitutaceae bacterium]
MNDSELQAKPRTPRAVVSSESEQLERIRTCVFPDAGSGSVDVAHQMARLIRERGDAGRTTVLGLATGSSPIRVYEELCRLHREEGLSFARVVTFNLDEYYPMDPDELQSYVRFMHEHLFDHIDIRPENIHIPDGRLDRADVYDYCQDYERLIAEAGGIDLQLLGIGRTGHIGFNEPGSTRESRTRMVTLDRLTRMDAAADFFGESNVPRRAITMGVGTIMEARELILLAWGEAKAAVVQKAVEGPVTESITASFLQSHPDVSFVLDSAAASELTRFRRPWLVTQCEWSNRMTRRAVVWLSHSLGKPILKLTDADYSEHGAGDLVTEQGPAYTINIRVFNELQHTISGWPGGKPHADDSNRPERALPFPKKALVLVPEPAGDVIGMGGTIRRLVEQGHEVHVAYLTSGGKLVSDPEARRFVDFILGIGGLMGDANEALRGFASQARRDLDGKRPGVVDSTAVRRIKGLIRQGEARAAIRLCGVDDANIDFLELPFYDTGRSRNNPLSAEDIDPLIALLETIQPQQVFVPGDLQNPGSTRRMSFEAIENAMKSLACRKASWLNDCWFWVYPEGWREWDLDEIDMAVPVSPDELDRKSEAIYQHQSQKSPTPSGARGSGEFWQRAEAVNRALAERYDRCGLAEYEGIEVFRRWKPFE